MAEVGDDRGVGIEGVDVDGDAPVLAERSPVDADDRLGDHRPRPANGGEGRDRRHVVLAEGEAAASCTGPVGQAADAGGGTGAQACRSSGGTAHRAPVEAASRRHVSTVVIASSSPVPALVPHAPPVLLHRRATDRSGG